ncbi:hypothetical protein NDU88_002454 [Pleurodeles waltl]|uniref:Uncharacterized protein n=1 Tax=Pleurodeles waltl TaxID=8319 RepID=A0AAV7TKQ4_PLEWA|nr:hypothetical protein NDU88_002454 [Pleurodeles waltl]
MSRVPLRSIQHSTASPPLRIITAGVAQNGRRPVQLWVDRVPRPPRTGHVIQAQAQSRSWGDPGAWISTWSGARVAPPHLFSFLPLLLRARPKRPAARARGRQPALGGGRLQVCGDRPDRPVSESPGRGRARQSNGGPPRSSSIAPRWCKAPGHGSGGSGTPPQARSTREPTPRHRKLVFSTTPGF